MVAVGRVTMPPVHVIHVIPVRYRDMTTPIAVRVVMPVVRHVTRRLALVEVTVMRAMQMSIVHVVDMVLMRHGDMAATNAMHVIVSGVFDVRGRHRNLQAVGSPR